MLRANRTIGHVVAVCAGVALVAGCGVSKVAKDAVANADTVVSQAQKTLGNSEAGALELQRARDHLAQAQSAVKDGKEEFALRHAEQATLDARLATSKAQTAIARKAADDLRASIDTLRRESERSLQTPR